MLLLLNDDGMCFDFVCAYDMIWYDLCPVPPRPCNISLDPLIESLIVGVGWAWLVKRDVVCHYTYHPAHDDDEIRGIHPRCLKHPCSRFIHSQTIPNYKYRQRWYWLVWLEGNIRRMSPRARWARGDDRSCQRANSRLHQLEGWRGRISLLLLRCQPPLFSSS